VLNATQKPLDSTHFSTLFQRFPVLLVFCLSGILVGKKKVKGAILLKKPFITTVKPMDDLVGFNGFDSTV
jgi:hypothetical protein